MVIYSVEQIRSIENKCVQLGFSEQRLMENAGSIVASEVRKMIKDENAVVAIVCGKGNNGGDGFVAARKLSSYGIKSVIILPDGAVTDGLSGEMFMQTQSMGIATVDFRSQPDTCRQIIEQSSIIIDALYGIGFHGELTSRSDLICRLINSSNAFVVSIDVPSGIECDTAYISKNAIKADMTITMFGYKSCNVMYPAADYCGETVVADLGIPEQCKIDSDFKILSAYIVKSIIPERNVSGHKGTFGKIGVFCGSYGMTGAAVLCSKAAYRSGCGLVKMFVDDKMYPIIAPALPEAVFDLYDDSAKSEVLCDKLCECDAVIIGCGIEKSNRNRFLLYELIRKYDGPLVIDGTALRLLAENIDILNEKKGQLILTPHDSELADLCSVSLEEIIKNRLSLANQLAKKYAITIVEKGAHTIIHCSNGKMYTNLTGNNGLATAGSGDVLAGCIVSLCAQGLSHDDAACVGVFVHGLSADNYAKDNSMRTMMASDIHEGLRQAFLQVE